MRDYLVLAIVLCSLPFCFIRPFFGALMWTWLAFMNPQRLAWGVARHASLAMPVAIATLAGFAVSRGSKRLPRSFGTYALAILWVLLSLSTLFAAHPDEAIAAWVERSKILLMALVVVALTVNRERLRLLCLVTALSVAFFGFTGGIFAILTGGQYRVYGPEGTFLGANNGLALALNMVLPMLFYLSKEISIPVLRLGMRAVFGLSILAVVCTYSRGGVLGLAVVITLIALRSGRKLLAVVLLAGGLVGVFTFTPEKWSERMQTIETYQQDQSAIGRINAWRLAWRLGLARPLLGFGPQAMEDKGFYDQYYPDSPTHADVHSTYFQLLGENGFPALGIFLALLIWCLVRTQRLRGRFRSNESNAWVAEYAEMLQIGVAAFMVSGLFLEKAFFDLIYQVVGATMVLDQLALGLAAEPARVDLRRPVRPGVSLPIGAAGRSKDALAWPAIPRPLVSRRGEGAP